MASRQMNGTVYVCLLGTILHNGGVQGVARRHRLCVTIRISSAVKDRPSNEQSATVEEGKECKAGTGARKEDADVTAW
jgi:hypothetical protein